MGTTNGTAAKGNGDSVGRGVAALGAGLALAVGFFLGFTVHGMLGGKTASQPTTPTEVSKPGPAVSGPLAERIQAVEKQIKLEPNNAAAWTELGNLYFDTKQPDKAIAAYDKSLSLHPGNPDVLTDQGVMYREVGKFDEALVCFNKAIAVNPGHVIAQFNKSIVLEFDKHDKAAALAALKELAAKNPEAVLPGGRPVSQAIQEMSGQ
jgi:cytochrome c-type biogenesis protein CcmH/NrfG